MDTLRVPKLVPHPALQPGAGVVDPSKRKTKVSTGPEGWNPALRDRVSRVLEIRECQWTIKLSEKKLRAGIPARIVLRIPDSYGSLSSNEAHESFDMTPVGSAVHWRG